MLFTANNGEMQSLNYPQNYPSNLHSTWVISVEENMLMVLHFIDFDVEGGSCLFDYMQVLYYNYYI